jgi:hypothetical protein
MRTSRDGNLREVVIRDKETIYVLSEYAIETRRTPGNAACRIILKALERLRPKGKCIPENQFWQRKSPTDPAVETIDPAGAEKVDGNEVQ